MKLLVLALSGALILSCNRLDRTSTRANAIREVKDSANLILTVPWHDDTLLLWAIGDSVFAELEGKNKQLRSSPLNLAGLNFINPNDERLILAGGQDCNWISRPRSRYVQVDSNTFVIAMSAEWLKYMIHLVRIEMPTEPNLNTFKLNLLITSSTRYFAFDPVLNVFSQVTGPKMTIDGDDGFWTMSKFRLVNDSLVNIPPSRQISFTIDPDHFFHPDSISYFRIAKLLCEGSDSK